MFWPCSSSLPLQKFVKGTNQVIVPVADMRTTASPHGLLDSQMLFGELVEVVRKSSDGYAWCRSFKDEKYGDILYCDLSPALTTPNHFVCVPRALVYLAPSHKEPVVARLSLNARVQVDTYRPDKFWKIHGLGYIEPRHVSEIGNWMTDPVDMALRFLGTPYVWGGRDSWLGVDCSGFIHDVLRACGKEAPRDAGPMHGKVGNVIARDPKSPLKMTLQSRDLILWKGHVAMMVDAENVVHATMKSGRVLVEPLRVAVEERLEEENSVRYIQRLEW